MFNTFYKLMFEPFAEIPYSKFFWIGENQKAALGGMKKNILANSQGVILLIGDEGQGKSTLIDILINRIKEDVNFGRITKEEDEERMVFLEKIARSMGLRTNAASKVDFFLQFTDHLIRLYRNSGKNSLLILENGQLLTQEILDDLAQISAVSFNGRKIVNILLVGDKKLLDAIEYSDDRTLKESLLFLCKTNRLSKQDTADYISHRLKIAGNSGQIFTEEAMAEIYNQTRGNLNTINELCSEAITLGTLKKREMINTEIILEVVNPDRPDATYRDEQPRKNRRIDIPIEENQINGKTGLSLFGSHSLAVYSGLALCSLALIFFVSTYDKNTNGKNYSVTSAVAKTTPLSAEQPQNKPANKTSTQALEITVTPNAQTAESRTAPKVVTQVASPVDEPLVATVSSPLISETQKEPEAPVSELVDELNNLDATAAGDKTDEALIKASTNQIRPAISSSETLAARETTAKEAIDSTSTSLTGETLPQLAALKKKRLVAFPELPLILQAKPNSDTVTDQSIKHLEKFTRVLLMHPETNVLIEGYIASKNDTVENTQLSQRRADHIKQLMIELGANPDQLQSVGRGNHNPIASNDTYQGRKKNRRIELSIIKDPSANIELARQ